MCSQQTKWGDETGSLIQNLSKNIKLLLREHKVDRRENPV